MIIIELSALPAHLDGIASLYSIPSDIHTAPSPYTHQDDMLLEAMHTALVAYRLRWCAVLYSSRQVVLKNS